MSTVLLASRLHWSRPVRGKFGREFAGRVGRGGELVYLVREIKGRPGGYATHYQPLVRVVAPHGYRLELIDRIQTFETIKQAIAACQRHFSTGNK